MTEVTNGLEAKVKELARVHIECDSLDDERGRLYVIKRISGVLDKNICRRILLKDIPSLRKTSD